MCRERPVTCCCVPRASMGPQRADNPRDSGRIFGRRRSQAAWGLGLRGGNVFGIPTMTIPIVSSRPYHCQPEIFENRAPGGVSLVGAGGADWDSGRHALPGRAGGCGIFPPGVRGVACPLFPGAGAGLRPRRADLCPFRYLQTGREALLGGLGARAGTSPAGLERSAVVVLIRADHLVQQRR